MSDAADLHPLLLDHKQSAARKRPDDRDLLDWDLATLECRDRPLSDPVDASDPRDADAVDR